MSQLYTLRQPPIDEASVTPEDNFEKALELIRSSTSTVARQTLAALPEVTIIDSSKLDEPFKNGARYFNQRKEVQLNLNKRHDQLASDIIHEINHHILHPEKRSGNNLFELEIEARIAEWHFAYGDEQIPDEMVMLCKTDVIRCWILRLGLVFPLSNSEERRIRLIYKYIPLELR